MSAECGPIKRNLMQKMKCYKDVECSFFKTALFNICTAANILEWFGTSQWGGSKQMSCPVTFCYSDCLWICIWGLWQGFLFDGFNYDHGDIYSAKEDIKTMLENERCGRKFYSDYKQWNTMNNTNYFDRQSGLFL